MAGPVPAIHAFSARGVKTWMAGTSPAMTARVWCGRVRCSHFVLDSQYKLSYIVVHPRLTRGALARRRSEEAGAVPPQVSQTCDRGWPILACPGPLKQTAHDEQFGSSFPPSAASRIARRATLDPSSGSQRKLRAPRCWLFDIRRSPASARPRHGRHQVELGDLVPPGLGGPPHRLVHHPLDIAGARSSRTPLAIGGSRPADSRSPRRSRWRAWPLSP